MLKKPLFWLKLLDMLIPRFRVSGCLLLGDESWVFIIKWLREFVQNTDLQGVRSAGVSVFRNACLEVSPMYTWLESLQGMCIPLQRIEPVSGVPYW